MTVSHSPQMLLTLEKCITISHVTLETVPKFETLERTTTSHLYVLFFFLFSAPEGYILFVTWFIIYYSDAHLRAGANCQCTRGVYVQLRMTKTLADTAAVVGK